MIQEAGDFLLQQGIITNRIDASKIVHGSYVQTYLRTRPKQLRRKPEKKIPIPL